jgi:hypothetical protein
MKTQKEVRHNFATGKLMLVLAVMLILGALGELRSRNDNYQYPHREDNNDDHDHAGVNNVHKNRRGIDRTASVQHDKRSVQKRQKSCIYESREGL